MTTRDLKKIIDSIPDSELDLPIFIQETTWDSAYEEGIEAELIKEDLVSEPNNEEIDFFSTLSVEQFEKDYPDEPYEIIFRKGQLIITID